MYASRLNERRGMVRRGRMGGGRVKRGRVRRGRGRMRGGRVGRGRRVSTWLFLGGIIIQILLIFILPIF